MNRMILMAAACLFGMVSLAQTPPAKDNPLVQQIMALEKSVNEAYAANDLPKYFSYYSDDLTQWFPEGRVSLPAYKASWTAFIKAGNKIQAVKVSDLQVQVSPAADTAVATYQLHVTTKTAAGAVTEEEFQESDVWFKRAGVWKIAHLHYSPAPPAGVKPAG